MNYENVDDPIATPPLISGKETPPLQSQMRFYSGSSLLIPSIMTYLEQEAFNAACTDMNNSDVNTDVFDFVAVSV